MKVQIDIAHPAHIHYFRNFAKIMEKKGHTCLFTLRERDIIVELAKSFNLNFKIRTTKEDEFKSKLHYAKSAISNIYKISKIFDPDIYIDMGTIFASPIAKIRRKPYIAFDDTEASVKTRALHMPFTDYILTPESFYLNLGKKHIKFNSFMELAYLHPNYRDEIINLDLSKNLGKNYVLFRFVSWKAHHDYGHYGLSFDLKYKLINVLKENFNVFISSENDLPSDLKQYLLPTNPSVIHSVLYGAKILITEGATMATEASLLGTPVLYCNSIISGNIKELEKNNILRINNSNNEVEIISKLNYLLSIDGSELSEKILSDKIDLTSFIVWFVENYPDSAKIMKENPDYQYRFK